jgi:hypothetical protein
MMWQTSEERLALLELLVRGTLKRRVGQAATWAALAELSWTTCTGRRDELGLRADRRDALVALLDRVWPTWGAALADLTARGLAPTPEGWSALADAQRAAELGVLPARLNRRTAAALAAPHSKAQLTDGRRAALGDLVATHDGSVRIRPPAGLTARTPHGVLDLTAIAAVLGEVSLPERALSGGFALDGPVRAVLLIENLGPFCDLPSVEGWLFAHVPGWDTATVTRLLTHLAQVPVVHFGDLDPNGVRIFRHLRAERVDLRWFVPPFWEDLIEAKGLHGTWPADLDLCDAPGLVQRLAERGLWLEQEPLAVDPRTPSALAAML